LLDPLGDAELRNSNAKKNTDLSPGCPGCAADLFARPAVMIPLAFSLTTGFAPPNLRNHTCWAVLRTLFVNL